MEAQFKLYTDSEELFNVVSRSVKNVEKVCSVLVRCKHNTDEARAYYADIAEIAAPEQADLGYSKHHAVLADALFVESVKDKDTIDAEAVHDALCFFLSRFGLTVYEAQNTSTLLNLIRHLNPAANRQPLAGGSQTA